MITVAIINKTGQQVSTVNVDPVTLGGEVNKQLLHDAVVMYEANRRQGNVQTKGRSDVAGSKKKLYKQKGTGRARMGPKRSPIRRGGGHAHHKLPVDWGYRLNKKALKLATKMAVLSKLIDGQVTVIDEFTLATPKTKDVATVLNVVAGLKQPAEAPKKKRIPTFLLTTAAHDAVMYKSARNIEGVSILPASDLNAYDILAKKQLVMTKAALDKFVTAE